MSPVGWKPRASRAGRAILRGCKRTVAGQSQIRSSMHRFEVATTESREAQTAGKTKFFAAAKQLQQQNCSGGVSTQIGHAPVRLEAQNQKQQFSADRAILRSSRTVAGQCQIRSGMHPFGWKPLQSSLGSPSDVDVGRAFHREFWYNTPRKIK